MGFFKSIGKAIKKNVSFKNLVKIATPVMGAIPLVGGTLQNVSEGLQASHQAKKDAKAIADENARLIAEQKAEELRQQTVQYAGANLGAIVGAGTNMFGKAIVEGAYSGASTGVKQGLGTVGAEVADSTLKAWFTKHWKHILIGLSVLGALYLIKKHFDNQNPRNRAKRFRR